MEGDSLFSSNVILGVGTRDSALLFDRAYLPQFLERNPETGQVFLPRDPCLGADVGNPPDHCLLAPIKPNLAVVTRQGILGRLASVGHNAARVRLLTDRESELPVFIGDFRIKGLVRGTGRALLTLTTTEAVPGSVRVGDIITTSNIDPDIPFLFHVGEIVELEPEILVRLLPLRRKVYPNLFRWLLRNPWTRERAPFPVNIERSPKSRTWSQFFFGLLIPMGTFCLALIFDSLPIATGTTALLLPSLALPVLFYWSVQAPQAVPLVLVFGLGLVMDTLHHTPLGLHALAFMAVSFRGKITV